ncbi:HAMP domain-containing sensor histidine kinase [Viridibacillus arvi]|uniref:HAMP domain-containing sensor histidine kinase n=1 Tax=Viridibacillus arvi TaxID=263475 RepID=UPI00187BA98C|nr:HAMP domain-containing sensor histidine kinase [Viridibacillus sp. JNUCC-6]QOV09910.1 HAMP domain-containing histidine kinase [Viridibacillus sp. JNUCC-6]
MLKNRKKKRVSLTRYWTTRYLLTLCIGLTIIAFISAIWLRHTTLVYRLDMIEFMAEEMTHRISDNVDAGIPNGDNPGLFRERDRFMNMDIKPVIYIVNTEGKIISSNRPKGPQEQTIQADILSSSDEVQKLTYNGTSKVFYAVKKKIEIADEQVGWVVIVESKERLTHLNQEYGQLAIMIGSLALLGLGAIYFLSRRLATPIKEVAAAAKQVQQGNYNIKLPENLKEEEVYELVRSFKEMAMRLEQLESMRTELLAGVTHELKTPVTSISGLLQAIQDGVVSGDDAREFVKMAINETSKLKTMVGDLLAFNSFAVNAIPVKFEELEINQMVKDVVNQWRLMQDTDDIQLTLTTLKELVTVNIDAIRFQQIFTNLFTNAEQAMKGQGNINVVLYDEKESVVITVSDHGQGIPKEEQDLVFERFYRGENKKYEVRGLGLGLPLSKMMAQSIHGDLHLVESSEKGTTFKLIIQKANN